MKRRTSTMVMNVVVEDDTMQSLRFTLNIAKVRREKLEGREHIVVPMVMIVEGVLNGSKGPLLYPSDELSKSPSVWDHKPIVIYHPTMNGIPISACKPEVINARKVGVILNTKVVTEKRKLKLKAEAWLEENRLREVDERVLDAINSGRSMEVSTGLFTENEDEEGVFSGKKYVAVARNYKPDHLAILPDQMGACSMDDGAGLLRNEAGEIDLTPAEMSLLSEYRTVYNEKSQSERWNELVKAITDKNPEKSTGGALTMGPYIMDVYETFVVFERNGKMFKQDFTNKTGDAVSLVGIPTEVVRVSTYKTLDGTIINQVDKEKHMDRQTAIAELIKNTSTPWEEDDRTYLTNLSDDKFDKVKELTVQNVTAMPKDLTPAEQKSWDEMDEPARAAFVAKRTTKNQAVPAKKETAPAVNTTPKQPETVEEYIANAPEGMRDVLESGLATHNAEKGRFIQIIMANKQNTFTAEDLQGRRLGELKGIAALATVPAKSGHSVTANYSGMADVGAPAVNAEEPLVAPGINWTKS